MIQELIDAGLLPSGAIKCRKVEDAYWLPDDLWARLALPVLKTGWQRPEFYILRDSLGKPVSVKTSVLWGKKSKKIIIEGLVCNNYLVALQTTYDKANLVEPEDVRVVDLRHDFIGLLSEDRNDIKFQGPSFNAEIKDGMTHFIAAFTLKGITYASSPHPKKSDAIIELATVINSVSDISLLKKVAPQPMPKKPKAVKQANGKSETNTPVKSLPSRNDMNLLKSLNARWRCEHDWLMKIPKRTKNEEDRLYDISRFLAVSDPLRWFEVSPTERLAIIEKLKLELEQHAFRQTETGQLNVLAKYLRAMVKGGVMSPGDPVDVGEKWSGLVFSNGDKPNVILERLVALKLLRDSGMGARYSLSNRAISLVNIHLKNEFEGGSIGSVTPVETLFALLKSGSAS